MYMRSNNTMYEICTTNHCSPTGDLVTNQWTSVNPPSPCEILLLAALSVWMIDADALHCPSIKYVAAYAVRTCMVQCTKSQLLLCNRNCRVKKRYFFISSCRNAPFTERNKTSLTDFYFFLETDLALTNNWL